MKAFLFAVFAVFLLVGLTPHVVTAQSRPWSAATAHTVEAGALEGGLFQPIRYGVRPGVELSTSIVSVVSPGFNVKIGWRDVGAWRIATQHGVNYPSPLLRLVSREGVGGMLPPDSRVPHVLSIRNRVLATRALAARRWITVDAGVRWAVRVGELDMPTLDVPLFYPRTASYHGDPVIQAGSRLDGYVGGSWGYVLGIDVLYVTGASHLALEHTGLMIARTSRRFQPFAGYRWIRGEYPFGVQRHWIPLAGFRWLIKTVKTQ